jgi:diguanylate cyclase (GGDEF)-like protein
VSHEQPSVRAQLALARTIIDVQRRITEGGHEPDRVMQIVAETTLGLVGASGSIVELAEGDELVYRAAAGSAAEAVGTRLKVATSLSGRSMRLEQPLRCDDSETDDRVDRDACRAVGLRSMVVVPLIYGARCHGVLKVISERPNVFTDATVDTLATMASFISASLRNAEAYADHKHDADHDALTGLANRRRFLELLDQALDNVDASELTAFFVDLDNFKQVNDTLGHAAGDALLVDVARRLSAVVRDTDVVARIGGDEFVVLCRTLPGDFATQMAARLDAAAAAGRPGGLTGASVGVVRGHAGETAGHLLERADAAMYQHKRPRRLDSRSN